MNKFVLLLMVTVLFSFACTQSEDSQDHAGNTQEAASTDSSGADINRTKPEKDSKIVARVNGVPIYEDDLKNRNIDAAVTEEILYQEGLKRGLYKKYEGKIMDYQKSLIVNDVESGIISDLPPEKPVYEQDIQEYYNANKKKYTVVQIEEINFKDESQGEEIKKMAAEGVTFQDIANKLGGEDSGVNVRDLGYNRTLARRFNTWEVGNVTDVIKKTDGTYSVLKIVQVKDLPLDYAEKAIRNMLESEGQAQAINDAARKIAEENNMKIEIVGNNPN